ncbi:MAG: hypothetical protein ACFCUO_13135 [Rhodospirillales bacterium]
MQGLQGFAAAHGAHGFFAAQGPHGFFAAQGLQGLQGLVFHAATRRGTTHLSDTAPPPAAHGLQGLQGSAAHGPQGALGAHGRHEASRWPGRGLAGGSGAGDGRTSDAASARGTQATETAPIRPTPASNGRTVVPNIFRLIGLICTSLLASTPRGGHSENRCAVPEDGAVPVV